MGTSHRADALDIVSTFDSSITSASNAADIENSINIATAAIGGLYSNPGTVKILFEYQAPTNANFLGESFTQVDTLSYSDYTALLAADSNSHPENTALASAVANLPNGNDASGSKPIEATTAMLRVALGDASATPCFDAQGNFVASCNSIYDGVIILNPNGGIDFTRPIPAYNGSNVEYDAIETEEHEIDEILGGGGQGSTLGGSDEHTAFGALDLYRYSAPDTGSHTPSPNATSYFSIDGGQTNIAGFFQDNDGSDYGDFGPDITPCPGGGFGGPGYVQDAETCNNKQTDVTNASPEFIMLEALGYNPSAAAQMPVIAWNCSTSPDATNYSGSINAIKEGSCTQIVTGDSTFTGGTNIETGTLQLGNGSTTGSVTGDITDNGTLVFDHANTITYAGVISGGGTLKQSGTGTLILTGDNSFTGLTTITLGDTLQLGNGGETGSIAGGIANRGTLIFDRSNTFTYAGTITGQGNVELTGGGTLIFTGTNTYSGGTAISSGSTLQIGDGGTGGLFQGVVTDNGTLAFDHSDTVTFKAKISGSGVLAQIGTGTTIFTAASSYTGGTLIGAGTLQIGNGGTTGMIVGDVMDNSALAFNRTDDIGFSGAISGSGMVLQKGSGTLTLSGNNTYSGGTGVGTGTLEAASSGALGTGPLSLDGTPATLVLDNGVDLANPVSIAQTSFIDVNGSDSATLSGTLSGSAPFEKDGTGTLIVSGNNAKTYSGDISFHGTLSVGATGALGTGTVTVLGSNLALADGVTFANPTVLADDLTIEQNGGAATIIGPISSNGGAWGITKTGTGTLTLANNNTFTGQTIAANGVLIIGGSLLGGVTVNSGASVAITGVVAGGVNVQAGGTLSQPALGQGFTKATLASYSETDSTLSINFGGISSGFANSSLAVPGMVVLQGGILDAHPTASTNDYAFDQRYIVIASPNAISGAFNNPAGFVANAYDADLLQRIRYDLGGVVLEVRRLIDFSAVGTAPDQKAAGAAIDSTEADATDSWANLLNALSLLSPAKQANALSQISGESLLDATHIASDGLDVFDDHLRAHVIDVGGGPGGRVATLGDNSHIWIATLGRDEHTNSYNSYSGYHTQVGELAFGGDTALNDAITAGVAASTGRPRQTNSDLSTSISGNLNAYGVYGRFDPGPAYITAALTTDTVRLHEHRLIAFGPVDDPASASFHQRATMGSIELDLRLAAFGGEMEPLFRFSYIENTQSGFQETDNGTGLGLNIARYSHDTLTETVGARWRRVFHDNGAWIAPEATAAVALDGVDDLPATHAVLQGAPANTGIVAVTADRSAPASGVLDLGMAVGLDDTPLALRVDYEGQLSDRATGQSASLNVSYAW